LSFSPECDLIFTVSRDRTLRAWDSQVCNIAWVAIPPLPGLNGDGQRGSVPPSTTPGPFGLLSPDPRILLRVMIGEARTNHNLDDLRILVFIPTPFSDDYAGFFILYGFDTRSNKLVVVGEKPCSPQTLGCELRDFQVSQGVLHAVWDTGGRTLYETTQLDIGDWVANSDDEEQPPDLWQEAQYLDDEVLSPTFTDMFNFSDDPQAVKEEIVNAILRPGGFSPYTVQTALEGYCKSLLTMPDPPYKALHEPYEGIVERICGIVGCTVTKVVDPTTGAELWENHWMALKRDIEGFLARCRDMERSARWPLALARYEDQIVLLERERTGMLVNQDVPLSLYRRISFRSEDPATEDGLDPPSQYPILNAAMLLRYRIHAASWKYVEDWLRFFPKSEPEQTYNTILLEMAQELDMGSLDESTGHAVLQLLDPLEKHADLRAAFTQVIHLLRDVGVDVKDEEDEHEEKLVDIVPKEFKQPNIDHHHQWSRSVTASYLISTLEARYVLISSVLFLLLFLVWRESNDYNDYIMSQIDADIIDEFFALHRSIVILKYIGAQVTEGPEGKQLKSGAITPKNSIRRESTADTLMERLEGMDVSRGSVLWPPDQYHFKVKSIQSLLQALLDPLPDRFSLPYASDHFLRSTRLLASESALVAGDAEVNLLARVSGYPTVVLQVADWLPKIGGVCYVVGRTRLQLGEVDEAADYFEPAARNFGMSHAPNAKVYADYIWSTQVLSLIQVLWRRLL
jgi:nuclear pore complex protein Nup160